MRARSVLIDPAKRQNVRAFASHPRRWRDNLYVYPVISRRSGGLSVGINLNPDATCTFNCVYCQVDRTRPRPVRDVDLDVLRDELDRMLSCVADRSIYDDPQFSGVPDALKRANDIAFSGDGEPTTCPVFCESVELAAKLKAKWSLTDTKIVLITNACHLTTPRVAAALAIMDANNGEVWAKLDAGTEEHYRAVNRGDLPLQQVIDTIAAAAQTRAVCIQSLWMRLHGRPPEPQEVQAFADRLCEIASAGGRIALVQVYTVARQPVEPHVSPLSMDELAVVADVVRRGTGLPVATY